MCASNTSPTRAVHETILVIEDELRSQRLLRLNLEPLGYTVVSVGEAKAVANAFDAHNPDLIILDLIFGEEKVGWQMLQKLRMRRSTEQIPVIVCTAAVQSVKETEDYLLARGVTVVAKPFSIDDLLNAVSRALEKQPPQV